MDAPNNTHVTIDGVRVPMRYLQTGKRCDAVGCTREARKPMKWCGTHRKQAEQMDDTLRELAKLFFSVRWPLKRCEWEGCETQVRKGMCAKHHRDKYRINNRERYRQSQREHKQRIRAKRNADKKALVRCVEAVVKNRILAKEVFDAIYRMGKQECRCGANSSSAPSC